MKPRLWWIGVLFMIGSTAFALGSAPFYSELVEPTFVGVEEGEADGAQEFDDALGLREPEHLRPDEDAECDLGDDHRKAKAARKATTSGASAAATRMTTSDWRSAFTASRERYSTTSTSAPACRFTSAATSVPTSFARKPW